MIDYGDELKVSYNKLPKSNETRLPDLGIIIAKRVPRDYTKFRIEEYITLDYLIRVTLMENDNFNGDDISIIRIIEDTDGHYNCCIRFNGSDPNLSYKERIMEVTRIRRI